MDIEKHFIKKQQILSAEDLAEKESISQIQELTKKEGPHLAVFAGDASLKYTPSLTAETFAFYPENNQVEVPVQWFLDKGYSPDELRWAFYHELSHFIDMRKNPKAFLDNFEYMREGGANQKISSWLEEKMEKDGIDQDKIKKMKEKKEINDEGAEMNRLEEMSYQYLHTMYNVLDDIAVNNLITQKAPVYSEGEGRKQVEKIYQKLGYSESDFKENPKHIQFIYSLLRDEMLPEAEKSIVDDEVSAVINRKKYGKTIKQIIDEKLKPKSGELPDPGERYKVIQLFIEPVYLELLKQDIENIDFKQMGEEAQKQKQQSEQSQEGQNSEEGENKGKQEESGSEEKTEKQEGDNQEKEEKQGDAEGESQDNEGEEQSKAGNQGERTNEEGQEGDQKSEEKGGREKSHQTGDFDFNPFKKYHENSEDPDGIMTEEEIEKMLEKFLEDKKYADMLPEERAEANQQKLKEKFDQIHGISPETRELFEKRAAEIRGPRKEMRKFWKKLIGASVEIVREKIRKQKRGNINVEDFIEKYPDIVEGSRTGKLDKPEIYERMSSEVREVGKPERIEVSLVCDMSGSMDKLKIKSLQKTTALLLLSLKDFNAYLDQVRRETKTKLSAYSEVYVFGSSFHKVKRFENETSFNRKNKDAEIIRTFDYLQNTLGSTNDAAVLSEIVDSVDDRQVRDIKKGKIRKIVFEVTDGQPNFNAVESTKQRVDDMLDKNIIPIAFQIGQVDKEERATFEYIWNNDQEGKKRKTQLGYYIGENIHNLPDELMGALKQKFGDIKL